MATEKMVLLYSQATDKTDDINKRIKLDEP